MSFNQELFSKEIYTQGFSIVRNALSPEFVSRAKSELEKAIEEEANYHKNADFKDYGMVLLCSLYDKVFCELFDFESLTKPFDAILGEGCIVYAYTSSSMPPTGANYSKRIHVDCPRIIPNYITNMGATILLDDFTEENGATWFLPNSQTKEEPPPEDEFYSKASRLTGKAGDIWFFNARLWHAGGQNLTDRWRHALTINMCRSWMKQRIDIPRAMAKMSLEGVSQTTLQKLGFSVQIPSSYDEYYAPPELRKFKQKAE